MPGSGSKAILLLETPSLPLAGVCSLQTVSLFVSLPFIKKKIICDLMFPENIPCPLPPYPNFLGEEHVLSVTTRGAIHSLCTPCSLACALVKAPSALLMTNSNGRFPVFVLRCVSGAFGNADCAHCCSPKVTASFPVRLIHFCFFLTTGSSLCTHHSHAYVP